MPWRNGGGTTREYLAGPYGDGFEWRLSVAEVAADGPFSSFPGIDRILVLLDGKGMTLAFEDATVPLLRHLDHHRFAGEASVQATLVDGPTRDLNLFWLRDRWTAEVHVLRTPCTLPVGALVLAYVAEGHAMVDGQQVAQGDLCSTGEPLPAEGDATLVVFALSPVRVASR